MTLDVVVPFFRIAAFVALLPMFGERAVPMRVKLAVAIGFTIIAAPLISIPAGLTVPLVVVEVSIGTFFGLLMRLMVLALQTAGSIAAQGTSLAQLFGGGGEPMPAIGHFLVVSGFALLGISGYHFYVIETIVSVFDLIPIGMVLSGDIVMELGLRSVARAFELAFSLAAPFTIASLLYNFMLGAINKAMPQLMVALVGAPAITFLGILLLLFSAPLILTIWQSAVFSVLTLE